MLEHEMRAPVERWLWSHGFRTVCEVLLGCGYCDFVGVAYRDRVGRAIPQIREVIAIELKLSDVAGVVRQAKNNKHFAHYSYAAMPHSRCAKMKPRTVAKFTAAGVGLMELHEDGTLSVRVSADRNTPTIRTNLQRTLWRRSLAEPAPKGPADE